MRKVFTAEIKKAEGVNGAYVEIPFDVEEIFGAKRVKVKARFNEKEYRGSIVSMGGCYMIGITQAIRKEIGKDIGDLITVEIEKDEDERVVEIPEDFEKLLDENPKAKEFFNKLSYTNKKEYITWITSAKKEETRKNRIEKTIELLKDEKKLK
ncbi:hypothetical protein ABG79_00009 [Caloramator mitchellensis]|uniref:Antitermination protein NusB n=1 Tax=Caloramator mitchellensis TaxID=908809 RepID=A0A0R3K359_CALMK|nr:YdeI/OmpD-associated family protein [Caloramator mitchellensis]KRQ87844.1 hypothetical protein ABG79_00009 [Caloramator mitchellensis]